MGSLRFPLDAPFLRSPGLNSASISVFYILVIFTYLEIIVCRIIEADFRISSNADANLQIHPLL
jgi:hypothetical protein